MTGRWRIRYGAEAQRDFEEILTWTAERFGAVQAGRYGESIVASAAKLDGGPNQPASRARDEIGPGLRTLHMGGSGRHFILYRAEKGQVIAILRILHDGMDPRRHLPASPRPKP